MASRREEKERLRAERIAAERHAADTQRRRLIAGYFVAGLLGLAVVVGIGIAIAGSGGDGEAEESSDFPAEAHIQVESGTTSDVDPDDRAGTTPPAVAQANLDQAAKQAGCELQQDLSDEGNTHTDAETVAYKTNPPTSGDHNPNPQADGAYAAMPDPVNFVHALEHGRIEIQYSPELPEADQLAIKGIFDEDPFGMLLFPNPDMPSEVAATAWTQMLACASYEGPATLDAIRAFRDTYRGQGPEPVPIQLSG
jgi:hypothetical protein